MHIVDDTSHTSVRQLRHHLAAEPTTARWSSKMINMRPCLGQEMSPDIMPRRNAFAVRRSPVFGEEEFEAFMGDGAFSPFVGDASRATGQRAVYMR